MIMVLELGQDVISLVGDFGPFEPIHWFESKSEREVNVRGRRLLNPIIVCFDSDSDSEEEVDAPKEPPIGD